MRAQAKHLKVVALVGAMGDPAVLKNTKLYSSFLSQFQSLYFGEQSPLGAKPVALDRAARQQKRSLYSSSVLASLSRGVEMTIDRPGAAGERAHKAVQLCLSITRNLH